MPRRNRDKNDKLARVLTQVQRRFDNSPLAEVGQLLSRTISEVQGSIQSGSTPSDAADPLVAYVTAVIDSMPATFGDRFTFDAQLIGALAAECSAGNARLSSMLVPKPSMTWGHATLPMPSGDRNAVHFISVIHLPGDDNLVDIDLLNYPFLCHEIGHNLLFRHGDEFVTAFTQHLNAVVADLQRKTLGIRGTAKQVSDSTIDQLRRYWNPTADHYNWAHEIAADVISLWLCGPAYIAALQDVMEEKGLDPHKLGQSHPPYELRARTLIAAAGELNWAYYTGGIQALLDQWSSSATAEGNSNLLVACADPHLLNFAVSTALQTCRTLSLPLCSPARIDAVETALKQGNPLTFGTNLILASWIKGKELTETDFDHWQQTTVRDFLADITP